MASFVLRSIDALTHEHECVKKVFCDGNKEARLVGHGFQYLTPVVSLSASYLSSKLGLYKNPKNDTLNPSSKIQLENLNGILYGMQETNCVQKFPDCQLN